MITNLNLGDFLRKHQIDAELFAKHLKDRPKDFAISGWRFINEYYIEDLIADMYFAETNRFFNFEDVQDDNDQWFLLPYIFDEDKDKWQGLYYCLDYTHERRVEVDQHLRDKSVEDVALATQKLIKLFGYAKMFDVERMEIICTGKYMYLAYKIV